MQERRRTGTVAETNTTSEETTPGEGQEETLADQLCINGAFTEDRARWQEALKGLCAQVYDDPEEATAQKRGGSGLPGKEGTDRKTMGWRKKSQLTWFPKPE